MASSRRGTLDESKREKPDRATAAFVAAEAHYGRGDYATAKVFLDVEEPATDRGRLRTALLRCRIARIENDVAVWYENASTAATYASARVDRLTADAMLGVAAARTERAEQSSRLLDRTLKAIEEPTAEGVEAAYLVALERWRERKYDEADAIAHRFSKANHGASLFLQLLGWSAVKRERFSDAGKYFARALTALHKEPSFEVRSHAIILHGIAVVACDTVDLKLCRLATREYDKIDWPPSLWYVHFNVLACLRYCRMLEGDAAGAWADARRAVVIAQLPSYEAIGEILAAEMSAQSGDVRAHEFQVAHAWKLIESVRWSSATSEERMALSGFALVGATLLPAEARKALMLLRSLQAKSNPLSTLDRDRRAEAFEIWADARIHEVSGLRSEAIALYKRSYEVWSDIGYILRTALVGLDLYRLTADLRWLEAYEALKEKAPDADISVGAIASDEMPRLTPAQSRVLLHLLDGQSAKAGAEIIGCSAHTFINHTRKVFEAFDVRSRDELKERCAELGIASKTLRSAGYR